MKSTTNPFLRHAKLAVAAMLTLGASSAYAQSNYWFDGGTSDINTNGNSASAGVDGTWNTTLKNWDQGAAAHFVWNNTTNAADTAVFGGNDSKNVTVENTVVAGKISMLKSAWTFTGGTLDVNVFDAGTVVTNTSFTSNLTGTIQFTSSAGNTGSLGTSAIATINGNNTGLTSSQVAFGENSNVVLLNNAGAFGNASATLNVTKGLLNLGGTSGTSISYNAWATDLAGTIRGRFDTSTWNGATNLTGNSQLMTRNASGVKLVFSSTGTIDLNDKTLSLWSSSTASGIELNGVISGTGNLETGGGFGALGSTADNATGTTTLGAANTFSGTATTTQNLGTLALNNVDALKNATLDTGLSGAQAVTFTVAGTNTYNIGALTGSDNLAIGANTISVGSKSANTTFAADISGSGGVTKTGTDSTLTLSGSNSFTGATAVTQGKLVMGDAATDSFATSGVTVGANGTLAGSGTLSGTLSVSGNLAPGNGGTGTLAAKTTTWNGSGGIWEFELGAGNTSDKLAITGDFLKGTGSTFQFDFMGSNHNGTFSLVTWTGTTDFDGIANNLLADNVFTYSNLGGGRTGSFSFSGNSLTFTAVPEPTSALAGLLITAGFLRRRRA